MIVLREMELEDYVESNKAILENDPDKMTWKGHNNKAMKIIIDSVKDHILPSIPVFLQHLRCSPLLRSPLKSIILANC